MMIKFLPVLPKYESSMNSGLEWVGEIPGNWQIWKLGTILRPVSVKNRNDLPLLSITREKGVIERDIEDQEANHNFIPEDLKNYKVLKKGQFGMNKMKAWQGSYGVANYNGIVSPAYYVFEFKKKIFLKFFHVSIRSSLYVSFFGRASDGVRIGQWDLSKVRMKEIPFIVPPFQEQIAIATFLDRKTAQIDRAVAIKKKQIALLRERKQILIQNAVTRGIDPDVPMRDSGVEWIGEIPGHWEVVANRTLFQERTERGREGLPLLSVSIHSAVSREELSEEENTHGRIKIEDKSKYSLVKPNDIVFNMMRAWQGAIGAVQVDGMVSPAYIVANPTGTIHARFFEYQYRCPLFIQQMDRFSKGITDFRKRLYWHEFKRLVTVLPPVAEQIAIVAHIETQSQKIDRAIDLQQQQIEKLKEYKATLINSAVTGKIRVPMPTEPIPEFQN